MAKPHRLLAVEDTPTLLLELVEFLENAGYEVEFAPSVNQAHEAIRKSKEENQPFAAILSDYNLGNVRPESLKTGISVYQYAYRLLDIMPPFIASSTEMQYWDNYKTTKGIYLIPKKAFRWDEHAVLAQLKDLGLAA